MIDIHVQIDERDLSKMKVTTDDATLEFDTFVTFSIENHSAQKTLLGFSIELPMNSHSEAVQYLGSALQSKRRRRR